MFYGLIDRHWAVPIAVAVCNVLGNGKFNNAALLLVETAAAETLLGDLRDPTERKAGTGITQVDEETFKWLKEKFTNKKEEAALKEAFGFTLSKVAYSELELSPLLAFVFARLRYRVVEFDIPTTLEGRAAYWKLHYNTDAGKGDESQYIAKARRYVDASAFNPTIMIGYAI